MNQLDITVRKHGQIDVLSSRGALVLGPAVDAMNETVDNLASHGTSRFVLSMGDVNRLDSSGIGLLVRMLEKSKKSGGTVKLVRPSTPVSATLRMCCVLPLFEVYGEEGDAIASFTKM